MSSEATENLFLLEFLVDSLELAPQCECASPPGETCVAFAFLDNAPLEICEEDFSPAIKYGQDNARLKSGKSCLFSLTSEQISTLSSSFDVTVSVLKKMQAGWLPDRIQVGTALISIANLFTDMIQSLQESPVPDSPTSKTLKDVFDILNSENTRVGKIGVYIRMSCFGKLIVTQFQMNFDDKSVLFKDKEGKSLYRYKKAPKGKEHKIDDMGSVECDADCPFATCDDEIQPEEEEEEEECDPGCPGLLPPETTTPPVCTTKETVMNQISVGTNPDQPPCIECVNKPDAPCVPPPVCGLGIGPMGLGFPSSMPMQMQPGICMQPGMGMPYAPLMTPCNECGILPDPPCLPGMMGGFGGIPGMQPCIMGYSPECEGMQHVLGGQQQEMSGEPAPPPGNYQEIGAVLGTNKLTIRVHKNSKVEPLEGNPADITNKSDIGSKTENINKTDNEVSGGDSCTCCPGAAAERKRRREQQKPQLQTQSYNMGLGVPHGDSRIPFSFKMGSMGQGAKGTDKNVVVHPPTTIAADGTQFTEISDPDKDLFILRIGKKSEGIDKKNNLELELCTPRAPDYKPQPKHETRDTQFDDKDLPPDSGGKQKKKGKDGKDKQKKGKKGKKGKK